MSIEAELIKGGMSRANAKRYAGGFKDGDNVADFLDEIREDMPGLFKTSSPIAGNQPSRTATQKAVEKLTGNRTRPTPDAPSASERAAARLTGG